MYTHLRGCVHSCVLGNEEQQSCEQRILAEAGWPNAPASFSAVLWSQQLRDNATMRAIAAPEMRGAPRDMLHMVSRLLAGSWQHHAQSACLDSSQQESRPHHPGVYSNSYGVTAREVWNCKMACRQTSWCRCVSLSGKKCRGPHWNRNPLYALPLPCAYMD